jgi:pyrroline-5-carboxylate reductase
LRRESKVKIARDLPEAIQQADIVVMAVRPTSVAGLLDEIANSGAKPRLCVSLAAGIPLKDLRSALPATRWVRAMPSPVCRVGKGLTALCFDQDVSKKDRTSVRDLFREVGQVVEVPEQQFDSFTATYSSSHGYHALVALSAAAQRAGLDPDTALTAAAHALADGIQYWRTSGLTLDELLQEAATPGGIAAATMAAMDKSGYGRVVQKGLAAGIAQARRNAKR